MVDMAEIDQVEDWLIGQALMNPHVPTMFGELCERLRACGLPIDRVVLAWATLHPLINAETVVWEPQTGPKHEVFGHDQVDTDTWMQSPMRKVLNEDLPGLRRRLSGGNAELDFPLCHDLHGQGFSDYLVLATHFSMPAIAEKHGNTGILVSWASKAEDGFSPEQVNAIEYIQKRLAISTRANLEAQITRNVAETYLGKWAGSRVLNGQIRHGDGQRLNAVIYFSDIRGSTRIAEDLGPDRYLQFLNSYFQATAGSILDHGGEILDFIGDAVLGVFPIEAGDLQPAALQALAAADMSRNRIAELNRQPAASHGLKAGIALSVGEVMFGNIGVPNRLTFSVIGQTVHAAARIEALTKSVGHDTLLTQEIAHFAIDRCHPVGSFDLNGFSSPRPLFALRE
ncbi:adenylate/guanylate cyclase domain-containing protein [Roseibium sp.]|uniref:adenylate/guanylate cyclase domain-containing protein n=1 Tax=Roseibium sp. TaxID=1936156 RepID=UPI003A9821A8